MCGSCDVCLCSVCIFLTALLHDFITAFSVGSTVNKVTLTWSVCVCVMSPQQVHTHKILLSCFAFSLQWLYNNEEGRMNEWSLFICGGYFTSEMLDFFPFFHSQKWNLVYCPMLSFKNWPEFTGSAHADNIQYFTTVIIYFIRAHKSYRISMSSSSWLIMIFVQ